MNQNKATTDPFLSLNKNQQTLIRLDFEGGHTNKEIAPKIGLKNETTVSHWRKRSWYKPAYNAYIGRVVKRDYERNAIKKLNDLLSARSEMVQFQAATAILRLSGLLSDNSTPELDKARIRKANADARVAEARAKAMEDNGADMELLLDKMLDTVQKEEKQESQQVSE